MAKKTKQKDNSKKAGLIAFGATLLAYALIFPFNKLGHFITGGLLAAAAGWVVKTMATPMKGLDKHAKSKAALDVTIIEDEYARGVVEKGVEMLDRFKTERDAINEYVFTRRINEIRENLDKVLRQIIDDPDKAHRIRKMNSYYLPTSLKLLESYRSAKAQGASYMSVSGTREDVLSMLDQLSDALTQVLDAMLKDDLEDMDIEIDVFERMLKSDGLQEDELTGNMRQSAHAAAKEIPMSKAPTVKPTAPVKAAAPVNKPEAKPVEAPQPVQEQAEVPPISEPEHMPEGVTLDYQAQVAQREKTPVPYLNVPTASASARQLNEGTPVLQIPESPAAPDFEKTITKETQA